MKTILITGASGGIGKAIVNQLAERKHNLLLVARNADQLKQQCAELTARYNIHAHFIAADLSKANAAFLIFEEVTRLSLEIDMLINNAGIGSGGEFAALSLNAELELLQLNIIALVSLTHLFLPKMQSAKSGTIVNIASMASFMPVPYMATYAASKAFVRSFTQAITEECKPYNVHVLLFCPGLTKTNFNTAAGIPNEVATALNSDYSSAPTQTPEEVADEMLAALDKGKRFAVSGRLNRWGAKIIALIPNSFIARKFAGMYRKKIRK